MNTDTRWEKRGGKKKNALPFMHICNIGSVQGTETSATAASAGMLKQTPPGCPPQEDAHREAPGCESSTPIIVPCTKNTTSAVESERRHLRSRMHSEKMPNYVFVYTVVAQAVGASNVILKRTYLGKRRGGGGCAHPQGMEAGREHKGKREHDKKS